MTYVTTLDVSGITPEEYRAVLDEMGVETRPAAGIYLHLTVPTSFGYRIVEVWDSKEGFLAFVEQRLMPALTKLGIQRETVTTIEPLHNIFAPRFAELAGLASSAPGAPKTAGAGGAS